MNDYLVFDDGLGPAIYLTGSFSGYGGVSASRIVRYDGKTWEALGAGLSMGEAVRLAAMPTAQGPSLFAFGYFQRAGAGVVNGTARWVGCPNCYANADLSVHAPALNVDDFVAFTQKYAARDPYANCNVDNVIDANDFACFLQKFAGGCGR